MQKSLISIHQICANDNDSRFSTLFIRIMSESKRSMKKQKKNNFALTSSIYSAHLLCSLETLDNCLTNAFIRIIGELKQQQQQKENEKEKKEAILVQFEIALRKT